MADSGQATILFIVEGHGETDAIPRLLRRVLHEKLQVYSVRGTAKRSTKPAMTQNEGQFKVWFDVQRADPAIMGLLFLFDADKDCARTHVPQMRQWAEEAGPRIPCKIVMIRQEYESWFLAALESLRGKKGVSEDAEFPGDSEANRGAKGILRQFFPGYTETVDQKELTEVIDLNLLYRNAPTFRRFVRAVCSILREVGEEPAIPDEWQEISSTAGEPSP